MRGRPGDGQCAPGATDPFAAASPTAVGRAGNGGYGAVGAAATDADGAGQFHGADRPGRGVRVDGRTRVVGVTWPARVNTPTPPAVAP